MNPYFWFLAVWGLMITPVEARIDVWFYGGLHWIIRIAVSGIPVLEKRRRKPGKQQKKTKMKRMLTGWLFSKRKVAFALVRDGTLKKMAGCMQCKSIGVMARISYQDAAASALVYSLIRTTVQTLHQCGIAAGKLWGHTTVDFESRGTAVLVRGIFSARLGTIAIAGFRLLISALRHHAELALEEKTYAASH